MLFKRLIRTTAGFCICLMIAAEVACTLPTTASNQPGGKSRLLKIGPTPGQGLRKLQFVSAQEGWLANTSNLWRTIDGGRSWTLAYSGEGSWDTLDSISSFEFINSQMGWMLVSPRTIYQTNNAGLTWTRLNGPDMVIHSIHLMKDGKRGWAAGESYRTISAKDAGVRSQLLSSDGKKVLYPSLFYTTDSGTTWDRQSLSSSEGRLLHLCFLDADHGWVSSDTAIFYLESVNNRWRIADYSKSECDNRILLETTQGNTESGVVYEPVAIYFLNADQGWLSFRNGYMAKSSDGGRTWCDLLNPRGVWSRPDWNSFFSKIHFADSKNGWGLGGDGSFYETDDSGVNWRQISVTAQFEDMYFLDRGNGWAIATEGLFRIGR